MVQHVEPLQPLPPHWVHALPQIPASEGVGVGVDAMTGVGIGVGLVPPTGPTTTSAQEL